MKFYTCKSFTSNDKFVLPEITLHKYNQKIFNIFIEEFFKEATKFLDIRSNNIYLSRSEAEDVVYDHNVIATVICEYNLTEYEMALLITTKDEFAPFKTWYNSWNEKTDEMDEVKVITNQVR